MKIFGKRIKPNWKEIAHYIAGGFSLLGAWLVGMYLTSNIYVLSFIWVFISYPLIDNFWHIVIKGEKFNLWKVV